MKFSQFLKLATIFKLLLVANFLFAQKPIEPVIPGDFADPTVIKANNQYYAVGTSSEWAPHFPIYTSKDLLNWKQSGYVFNEAPQWTSGSFWAPEYDYHDKTYFIYYTARRKKDNVSCIGVATSKFPDRDFVDRGIIIDFGKESIDAFIYLDKGIRYITFKAYGLDDRPIEILAYKLSNDGLHTEGNVFSIFKDERRKGLEGQSILNKDGYYYLFYSAGNCCGIQCDYNVRVARSTSFIGPYKDYEANPLLMENEYWKCSGHGTFVKAANERYYYLYHAYNKNTTVFAGRQGMLAELTWPKKNSWPLFKEQSGPALSDSVHMAFTGKTIDKKWQWDFRNSTPDISQNNGLMSLSGSINKDNLTGIALTIRPVSGIFEVTTTIKNTNNALKGLVYYGDAGVALGIGVLGDDVEVWTVKGKVRAVVAKAKTPLKGQVQLKMQVKSDLSIATFFKQDNQQWQEIQCPEKITISFLPQWDRSPRVGLNFKGAPEENAIFSSFELKYTP